MGPILSSLVNLQTIETELRKTQQNLKQSQQTILRQEHHIKKLSEAISAKKEEIKLTRMQHDRLELELKCREDDVTKLRIALNTARTNKDYSAILTRINTQKADKSKLEDQILALLSQIEIDQTACREIEQNIKTENAQMAETREQALGKQEIIRREEEKLIRSHDEAVRMVPFKERGIFLRLASRYNGEVLAKVEQLNSRKGEHCCGGCFMSIPLESVNSLMTRDELVICPSCGRLLVLDKNPQQTSSANSNL